MSIEGRPPQEYVLRAPYASLEERDAEQRVIWEELSLRTPSKEELFDLLAHLKEPVTGTRKRFSGNPVRYYSRDEIKQMSEGVLHGKAELPEVPQTFGLRSLVGARMQLDQLQKDVPVGLIAPPLTFAQFRGLLGNLNDIESTKIYTSIDLIAILNGLLAPSTSGRVRETMPPRCGLGKIWRGVISPLP